MLAEDIVEATERAHSDVDWPRLLRCLDSVYLVDGGGLAQWAFLNRPLEDLAGRSPAQTLPLPDGPHAVMRATRSYAEGRARTIAGRACR